MTPLKTEGVEGLAYVLLQWFLHLDIIDALARGELFGASSSALWDI